MLFVVFDNNFFNDNLIKCFERMIFITLLMESKIAQKVRPEINETEMTLSSIRIGSVW